MSGVFVCVVGPSGAGKDTLIDGARRHLSGDARFSFPRRIVTRESSLAEDHDTMSFERFEELERTGGFALSWSAHRLGYALPASVKPELAAGRIVVCNISRDAISGARRTFGGVRVVLVTAPTDVLRARLSGRGRESEDDVGARLNRAARTPDPAADLIIENVGDVSDGTAKLVNFLVDCHTGVASSIPFA